jgi:hypothetical protein
MEKITPLLNELTELVNEKFSELPSMVLIPDDIEEGTSEWFDWLYELPLLYSQNYDMVYGYYILNIQRDDNSLRFTGVSVTDYRYTQDFSPYEFSLSEKLQLLDCVSNVIEYNQRQTL